MEQSDDDTAQSLPTTASRICPHCGVPIDDAEAVAVSTLRKVEELEDENRFLAQKATAAVDKLADYEDEIRQLKCSQSHSTLQNQPSEMMARPEPKRQVSFTDENKPLPAPPPEPPTESPDQIAKKPSTANRFSSFLTRTKSVSAKSPRETTPPNSSGNDTASPSPPSNGLNSSSSREAHLASLLSQERTLRVEAEEKVQQVNNELEELSASLFQQANEMVAAERKARAKLEERAAKQEEHTKVLEEKIRVLEKRDVEKRKRLERLEVALDRIDRVKSILR